MPVIPDEFALGFNTPRPARGQPNYSGANPLAAAVQTFGGELAQVGNVFAQQNAREAAKLKAETDKQQDFGIQNRFIQFQEDWQKAVVDRSQKVKPGAAGFSDTLVKDFLPKADEFSATVPDEMKQEYFGKLRLLEGSLTDSAKQFEIIEGKRYGLEQLDDSGNKLLEQSARTPADWARIRQEHDKLADTTPGLDPIEADKAKHDWYVNQGLAILAIKKDKENLGVPTTSDTSAVWRAPISSGEAVSPQQYFGADVNVSHLPAGMRNNNPGNIKYGINSHKLFGGVVGPSANTDQGDPQIVFESPQAGMNAAASLVRRKFNGGKTTADQIIAGNGGWTPGNHGAAANVARAMGRGPNDQLNLNDPQQLKDFLRGLTLQEHGPKSKLYDEMIFDIAVQHVTGQEPESGFSGPTDMNTGQGPTVARGEQQTSMQTPPVAPEYAGIPFLKRVDLYNHMVTEDKQQFTQKVEDYSAYVRSGQPPTDGFSLPDMQRGLGPEEGQKAYDQLQRDEAYGADVARVKFASPPELQQIVDERQAMLASPEGFRENAQNLGGLATAIAARDAALKADPAAYVQQDPQVAGAYNAMHAAMNNQASPPAQTSAAMANYADKALGLQQQLGVPSDLQRILPKPEVADIARQFKTQPEGGQNAAQLMRGLEATWGKQWPKVFEQLAKDGELSGTALVVGAMNRPDQARAAEQLAQAAAAGKKAYEDILPTQDKTDITTELAGTMLDFQGTLVNNPGWEKTFGTFQEGVELLAMSYVTQGDKPAAAVAKAYDNVLGKKYELFDTFRVPRSSDYAGDQIARGADVAQRNVPSDIRLPTSLFGLTDAETRTQYASALKAQGFWVTSPDENGLTLYDGTRRAVLKADGSPYSLTWEQLNQSATAGVEDATRDQQKAMHRLLPGAPSPLVPVPNNRVEDYLKPIMPP